MQVPFFKGVDPVLQLNYKYRADMNSEESLSDLHPLLAKRFRVSQGPALNPVMKLQPTQSGMIGRWMILIVGCGGTGSHLVPNLLQYLHVWKAAKAGREFDVVLVDDDVV